MINLPAVIGLLWVLVLIVGGGLLFTIMVLAIQALQLSIQALKKYLRS